jgi:DNA mismatch repair protein MutL
LPVRKKFLKAETTEFKYIYDLVQNYALLNFNKSFKLIHNQKIVLDLEPAT